MAKVGRLVETESDSARVLPTPWNEGDSCLLRYKNKSIHLFSTFESESREEKNII